MSKQQWTLFGIFILILLIVTWSKGKLTINPTLKKFVEIAVNTKETQGSGQVSDQPGVGKTG